LRQIKNGAPMQLLLQKAPIIQNELGVIIVVIKKLSSSSVVIKAVVDHNY
jgi:hypothetical protein